MGSVKEQSVRNIKYPCIIGRTCGTSLLAVLPLGVLDREVLALLGGDLGLALEHVADGLRGNLRVLSVAAKKRNEKSKGGCVGQLPVYTTERKTKQLSLYPSLPHRTSRMVKGRRARANPSSIPSIEFARFVHIKKSAAVLLNTGLTRVFTNHQPNVQQPASSKPCVRPFVRANSSSQPVVHVSSSQKKHTPPTSNGSLSPLLPTHPSFYMYVLETSSTEAHFAERFL